MPANPSRLLIRALTFAIVLTGAHVGRIPSSAQADDMSPAERSLIERSSDVFIGKIDIVTGTYEADRENDGPGVATEYTVLVSETLKGDLIPPSIVVVRQDGGTVGGVADYHEGDGPLLPGSEFLIFARFGGVTTYSITEPVTGNVLVTSGDQREGLVAKWTDFVERTDCQQTDVLKLDGVMYARRDWNENKRYLEREWVGPTIATVAFQDVTATGCRDDLADGVASEVPAGTKIQELKGYATTFRVAVRMPDKHRYLYEAIWSERAETGSDLLDIDGRVTRLEFERWFECNDTAMCVADLSTTSDSAQIKHVLGSLYESPVEPKRSEWRHIPSKWLRLTFTLDDASTVTLWIGLKSGLSQSGILMPVDDLVRYLWGDRAFVVDGVGRT